MPKNLRVIALASAALIGVTGLWLGPRLASSAAVAPAPDGKSAAASGQHVETVRPVRATMSRLLDIPATVDALEQADLYAKVSGYVSEVNTDIGARVKAGDVLAVIEAPEIAGELHQAMARRDSKATALRVAENAGIKAADAMVRQAERRLDVTNKTVDSARVDLTLRQSMQRRQDELFAAGGVTQQAQEESRALLAGARNALASAEARVASAEADVAGAQAARENAAGQVEIARADVAFATAEVERLTTMVGYTKIAAPFDGVVTRRSIDRGALVQAATQSRGAPLLTVQNISSVRVFVDVPESDLAGVKPGTAVAMKIFALAGATINGTVTRSASSLSPGTRTMRAEIDLANADGRLLSGMLVQVQLAVETHPNVITISASALLNEGKQQYVFVIQDAKASRRNIKTGLDDGARVEVTDGLQESDQVVTTGKGLITDGANITPTLVEPTPH